jgi:hypothetical protein
MKVGTYFYDDVMNAKKSIYICSPWISFSYIEKLVTCAKKGISIKIITSDQKKNMKTVEALNNHIEQHNFDFCIAKDFHSKFFIIDGETAIDGSANFTRVGLFKQQNNITIFYDPKDIVRLSKTFAKIWKHNGNKTIIDQGFSDNPKPITEPKPPSSSRGALPKDTQEELPQELDPESELIPEYVKCIKCNRHVKVGKSKCGNCGTEIRESGPKTVHTPPRTPRFSNSKFEYSLYHMTDIKNLKNILKYGILSHDLSKDKHPKRRSDRGIVNYREKKKVTSEKTLTHYANFYFKIKNPMLYRILKEDPKDKENIIVLEIITNINKEGIFVSDGNCARTTSTIKPISDAEDEIESIQEILKKTSWGDDEELKRRFMAECLIPKKVESEIIHAIHVQNETTKQEIEIMIKNDFPEFDRIIIEKNPRMFFSN